MYKNINLTESFKLLNSVIIDVRSEGEYKADSVPGSVNIPLLSNEERACVGICYKNEGPEQAKRLGLEIISPKLVWMINAYDQVVKERKVVVYCWRGGLRSKFTASLLSAMGFDTYRLSGGYKAYRRFVYNYLDRDVVDHKVIVLCGLTGVGKTTVIKKLNKLNVPCIDLEGIAKHRGSVFGKIGLPSSPTQKRFESMIADSLQEYEKKGLFVIECESKRIGNLIVPNCVMNSMKDSLRVLLYAPLEVRVERIMKEYDVDLDNVGAFQKSITYLEKTLGKFKTKELNSMLESGRVEEVFSYLVEKYYDQLYGYPNQPSNKYDLCVDATDLESATSEVYNFIRGLGDWRSEKP